MTKTELELLVRQKVEAVKTGRNVEDSFVELKTEWIDEFKMAERLAGHANAARGEQVVWIIGVDEKGREVKGADQKELSNWWDKIKKHFEGEVYPDLITSLNIEVDDKIVVALLFDTDRPPYAIKLPSDKHGVVTSYIPWRTATRLRSANRQELLSMLIPVSKQPRLKFLESNLLVKPSNDIPNTLTWQYKGWFYIVPNRSSTLTLPKHTLKVYYRFEKDSEPTLFAGVVMEPATNMTSNAPNPTNEIKLLPSVNIRDSNGELIVDGPGTILFQASTYTSISDLPFELQNQKVEVVVELASADADEDRTFKGIAELYPSNHNEPSKFPCNWLNVIDEMVK